MKKLLALLTLVCVSFNVSGAGAKELKYIDASTLTILNKPQPDGPRLSRLDTDKYPDFTPTVRKYYKMSTGMAVSFHTNSPVIAAKWCNDKEHRSTSWHPIAEAGLDLYIKKDGEWLWAGMGRPKYKSVKHEYTLVDNMDTTMKECMIYLPCFMVLDSIQLGFAPNAVVESCGEVRRAPVVAMGSSYTHGTSTSRPGMTWPAQLSRILGVDVANYGTGGQQKMEQFFAELICDTDADMFIFDCFSNPNADQIRERFADFVKTVRKKHPNTPLVFLETVKREVSNIDLDKRKYVADKAQAAREEISKVMKRDRNIYFFEPGLFTGDDHETTVDGTHPSDNGYQRAAINIAQKINAIPALRKIIDDARRVSEFKTKQKP